MDFDIKRCTRRCAATDRELQPNEPFYSVLLKDGGDLLRQDFAESAWQGPPEGAVGCWKSRMPSAEPRKIKLAPNQVMLNLFEELADLLEVDGAKLPLNALQVATLGAGRPHALRADGEDPLVLLVHHLRGAPRSETPTDAHHHH